MKRAHGVEIVRRSPGLGEFDVPATAVSPISHIRRLISTDTFVSRGKLVWHGWARAFKSNDPKRLSDATRGVQREMDIVVSKMVSKTVALWLKNHEYDVETLLVSGIEIRFFPVDLPEDFSEVDVRLKMFAVNPGDPF